MAMDEMGRPFLIVREQEKKARISGIDAIKSHILAATSLTQIIKTSLGPMGLDKILVGQDGDVMITNDGATILSEMHVNHQIAKLLVELSQSQDNESGDGTTSVVVLAGALLKEAEHLINLGIHPIRIAKGFDLACHVALNTLDKIKSKADTDMLYQAAKTCLSSKIVTKHHDKFAKMAIDAIQSVNDNGRVNLDLVHVVSKLGGSLEDTTLIQGVVIDKTFSHPQMPSSVENAKIAILTCPFEPPKPKTKHKLSVTDAKMYTELSEYEHDQFNLMVKQCKDSGANVVMCQWGFDDEANHLLLQAKLPSVRWVGGPELERLAIATHGRIVPRFSELSEDKLGRAGLVKTISFGTTDSKMLVIEECANPMTCTILIRGGNQMLIDECKRSLHDALCVVRTLMESPDIVCGAGASDIACAISVEDAANSDAVSEVEELACIAFSKALLAVPTALADNAGHDGMRLVTKVMAEQRKSKNADDYGHVGVDCYSGEPKNMKSLVFDPYTSKRSQLLLATQLVKMVLKIDDVIHHGEGVDQ
eukprot:NODE_143_length_17796_cov_0.252020.p2 type:complete len:535 gc:universal NODE_143_length_17796_cov_0.252020:6670-8274(+)